MYFWLSKLIITMNYDLIVIWLALLKTLYLYQFNYNKIICFSSILIRKYDNSPSF